MPLTDGLSLIERALKLQPNLHSVIVSGYEDFHYARGNSSECIDYLTKPIDETSILSMLKKLTRQLWRGDSHNRTSARLFSMPNKEKFLFRRQSGSCGRICIAVISLYFASCFLQKENPKVYRESFASLALTCASFSFRFY